MTGPHSLIIERELDALAELLEPWTSETFIDEKGDELDVELLRQRLARFADMAGEAVLRIEWVLLNAGDHLSQEHRDKFSEMRGKLCQVSNWQEAIG